MTLRGLYDAACGERAPGVGRLCLGCGRAFEPRRPTQFCCAPSCRARLSRVKHDDGLRLVLAALTRGDLEDARVRLAEVLGAE